MNSESVVTAREFILESNRIEGIIREPTTEEVNEWFRFMNLEEITVGELIKFVQVYEPKAPLRRRRGMDVQVGNHVPPPGGVEVEVELVKLLQDANHPYGDPWLVHTRYEALHPFMDGNGRSGRMLWAWQMGPFKLSLGFLHLFYYQTLGHQAK